MVLSFQTIFYHDFKIFLTFGKYFWAKHGFQVPHIECNTPFSLIFGFESFMPLALFNRKLKLYRYRFKNYLINLFYPTTVRPRFCLIQNAISVNKIEFQRKPYIKCFKTCYLRSSCLFMPYQARKHKIITVKQRKMNLQIL